MSRLPGLFDKRNNLFLFFIFHFQKINKYRNTMLQR